MLPPPVWEYFGLSSRQESCTEVHEGCVNRASSSRGRSWRHGSQLSLLANLSQSNLCGKMFTNQNGSQALQRNLFGLDFAVRDSTEFFITTEFFSGAGKGEALSDEMDTSTISVFTISANADGGCREAPQNISRTHVGRRAPRWFGCLQLLIKSHWESSWSRFSLQSRVTFSYWVNVKLSS